MYKLIAIDVDGTLIQTNGNISNRTLNSIKKCKSKEMIITIATGRPLYRVKKYLEQMGLLCENQYTILYNGALVIENITNNIIFSNHFTENEVIELINISKDLEVNISLYTINYLYTKKLINRGKKEKNNRIKICDFKEKTLVSNKVYKIAFVDNPKKINRIKGKLISKLKHKYKIIVNSKDYIELLKKETSKANAVNIICKLKNIDNNETIAIGDSYNDIEMIENAGIGIAMKNAKNIIKQKADYVTDSNNNDGVGKALQRYVLNNP